MEWIKANKETPPIVEDSMSDVVFVKQLVDGSWHKNTGTLILGKDASPHWFYINNDLEMKEFSITDETYWLKD